MELTSDESMFFAAVRRNDVPELKRIRALVPIDLDQMNVLMHASRCGHLEVVKYACEQGADINIMDGELTPILAAVSHGHLEIVRFLLGWGADTTARHHGLGLVDTATWYGHIHILRFFRQAGIDLGAAQDVAEGHRPPIQWALIGNQREAFQYMYFQLGPSSIHRSQIPLTGRSDTNAAYRWFVRDKDREWKLRRMRRTAATKLLPRIFASGHHLPHLVRTITLFIGK